MKTPTLYTLTRAARILGVDRNLITYLVRDREIPVQYVGAAKCLTQDGFKALKAAVEDYRAKPVPEPATFA